MSPDQLFTIVAAIIIAVAGTLFYTKRQGDRQAQQRTLGISEAEAQARELVLEAKDEALKIKHEAEDISRQQQQAVLEIERSIQVKQAAQDARQKELERQSADLARQAEDITRHQVAVDELKDQHVQALERVASLTRDEARAHMLDALQSKLTEESARAIREAEATLRDTIDERAKALLVDAMRHGATDYVADYTSSHVKLPDDETKGRIIGKEGRNIKAFEMATGVDVDIDDTPGIIRLSCFDGVRREIARLALEALIKDGRIQPTRIEELVAKTGKEVDKIMREAGEKLAHEVGAYNLPREVIEALGRFKYRFSYGQNMLVHTLEETRIGIALAREIGGDVNTVRLGCLLHDIGKVFTDEEGTHIELGVKFAEKHHFPKAVVNIIAEHHEDQPFSSVESVIAYIADAISGSRPGARHESVEDYIKRLRDIEGVSNAFHGVDKSFAIQAGREVRVIVKPEDIDDSGMVVLAHDIAEKIHDTITYPGQVKVTVVRETRAFDIAR